MGLIAHTKTVSAILPAKVNLFLHVCGRRNDGYHLLESLVGFTEFGDRISAKLADDLTLTVEGPFAAELPSIVDKNLIIRAAKVLLEKAGIQKGAHIKLEKNIPISAGIGGGSADAAGTLRALTDLWRLEYSDHSLARLGMRIGADVPICIYSQPAIIEGVGEIVIPQKYFPPCGVVLANAGGIVSTTRVFAERSGSFTKKLIWPEIGSFDNLVNELKIRKNDLSQAAGMILPVIHEVLAAISKTKDCEFYQMSGSGGTCFGLYPNQKAAEKAAISISENNPRWWCIATKFQMDRPQLEIN